MPITTVPTGIFCQPYRLKLLVAASATFQEVTHTSSVAAASRHIHYPDVDLLDINGELIAERLPPRAVINDEQPLSRTKAGLANYWISTGTLSLDFHFYVPTNVAREGHEAAAAWFMTKTGSIMAEMEVLAGTGTPVSGETHLNMVGYSKTAGPFQLDIAEGELPDPDLNEYSRELWFVNFQVEFY